MRASFFPFYCMCVSIHVCSSVLRDSFDFVVEECALHDLMSRPAVGHKSIFIYLYRLYKDFATVLYVYNCIHNIHKKTTFYGRVSFVYQNSTSKLLVDISSYYSLQEERMFNMNPLLCEIRHLW